MSRQKPLLVALVVLAAGVGVLLAAGAPPGADAPDGDPPTNGTDFETFDSAADFRAYLAAGRESRSGVTWVGRDVVTVDAANAATTTYETARADAGAQAPDARYSGTNVQEAGIDEPDVVKTDGEYVYYAQGRNRKERIYGDTQVLGVQPPGSAEQVAEIERSGRLLRVGDRLVVFGVGSLYGYDVADPSDPEQVWSVDHDARVVAGRLDDGTLYVVLSSDVGDEACPVTPAEGATVPCTDIYHPTEPVPVDVTYTALALDPSTGEVRDSVSFVGSRRATVYASETGIYATYPYGTARSEVALEFLLSAGRPLLDGQAVDRLEQLRDYDLSPRATRVEVEAVLRARAARLDGAARERFRENLAERYREYAREHRGEFSGTHVLKLSTDDGLSVAATGTVPGRPLNQFSLDEHEGHLRIATTVSPPRLWGDVEPVNDVYVLDGNLSVTGSVTGMGENERIYSVRFVGDRGYVVTFRRVDPFHVLDLSDPEQPTMEGKLKLPGFSTYLHPLGDGLVLGVGEQDGSVKAVVFDASDPSNPVVEESRVLSDRWSAIRESHHAFLLDRKHGVFFLPGSRGGHVVTTDGLDEVYTVAVEDPRRAVYVGDYLYVFGREAVVVVDERNWTEVRRVELD